MAGSPGDVSEEPVTLQLILQPFRHFIYVKTHSPTLPSLYLRHSSFSNPSVASSTSQLILQPFFRFSYFTGSSLTSPGEPPMSHNVLNLNNFKIQFRLQSSHCLELKEKNSILDWDLSYPGHVQV